MSENNSENTSTEQDLHERSENRSQRPESQAFKDFMVSGWASHAAAQSSESDFAPYALERRGKLSELFPEERLIVPAGAFKVRSNDTDYRFRAHSAFAHLTGLGEDREPDAVLVLEPVEAGTGDAGSHHEATLYFRELAGHDSEEFYANARYGEFWIGPRDDAATTARSTGITVRDLGELEVALTKNLGQLNAGTPVRLLAEADPGIHALLSSARLSAGIDPDDAQNNDAEFAQALSELRLIKDEFELAQMRNAVQATITGFDDVITAIKDAKDHPKGERIIEGAFFSRARVEGNDLGYDTIAASGDHATILHWIRNDGAVKDGDLLLVDAGVEVDSLYTADLTRTLPVNGTFSPVQRRVYQAVLDAADAAFAAAVPGNRFRDVHAAAIKVLAERLNEWGLLPAPLEEVLSESGQQHRRWMPHGTSHHLGLDVHDCAQAKRELYIDGQLSEGMCFTIEPGLYFKSDDLMVPEEYRGIGVRIEDDIVMGENGPINLSAQLPRTPDEVEAWMARLS